jgi:putative transcriptional regulator
MPPATTEPEHAIEVHLDKLLAERGMTLTELADRVGVTIVNLSILKNGRAKAIRFTTLTRLCHVLGCQPGDLLSNANTGQQRPTGAAGARSAGNSVASGRGG